MTDLSAPAPAVSSVPAAPSAPGPHRLPYHSPRIQPLGAWTALTLVTSLPIGPGGMVFGGNTDA